MCAINKQKRFYFWTVWHWDGDICNRFQCMLEKKDHEFGCSWLVHLFFLNQSISTKSTGGKKKENTENLENGTDNQKKSTCDWICMNVNMWAQTTNICTPVIIAIVTVAIHVNNLQWMGFFVCRLQVAFALKINDILPNNFFRDLLFDRHSEKWGDFTWVTRICIKEKWTQILVYCSFGGSSKGGGGRTDGRGE